MALYSTPGRATDALVGVSRTPIELHVARARSALHRVPRRAEAGVAVGDVVYVTGPGSLPIGTVSKIDSDPSSPTSTLHITPAAEPLHHHPWVTIALAAS